MLLLRAGAPTLLALLLPVGLEAQTSQTATEKATSLLVLDEPPKVTGMQVRTPTGKLMITLYGPVQEGLRQKWTDLPNRPLESQIHEILGEAAAHAATLHEDAQRLAERMAAHRDAERQREERVRLDKLEEDRELFLSEKTQQFEDALRFEGFLAQLRRDVPQPPRLAAFLAWADDHTKGLRAVLSTQAIEQELQESELFA
jgi:hypothetical protein